MALMIGKLYDALVAARVPDDKARAAEMRLLSIEAGLTELKAGQTALEARLDAVESRLNMLIWIMGLYAAVTLAMLGILLARH
jgi:hypothetical protein